VAAAFAPSSHAAAARGEAGDRRKGSALRSAVEGAEAAIALPCYADEGRDIDALIDQTVERAGLQMALDARRALRPSLGGDRLASRGELEKLVLYAHGKGRIELADVQASTGDVSAQSADEVLDAVLDGRLEVFDKAFGRLSAQAGPGRQLAARRGAAPVSCAGAVA